MGKATIYLRTPLFTVPGPEAHVPPTAMLIECTVIDRAEGLTVRTERFRDERGRELAEASITLQIPWSKIDHVHVHEA